MSNIAKYHLEPSDRTLLAEIRQDYPGMQTKIAKAYGINFRSIWLHAKGKPMGWNKFRQFQPLLADLRTNRKSVLEKSGIVELAYDSETNAILQTAERLAEGQFFRSALDVLMDGFCRVAEVRTLESAAMMLPKIIYTGYRSCPSDYFCHQVKVNILPRVKSAGGYSFRDDLLGWTCASQLACALNEGGCGGGSTGLFRAEWVRQLLNHRDAPAWLGPQFMRNHAHHLVWYGSGQDSIDRGIKLTKDALAITNTVQNRHSVAHSQCDLYLTRRMYPKAWEAIADRYFAVRPGMLACRMWPASTGISVLLAYGIFLSGTLARSVLQSDGYTEADQQRDIAALAHWLDQFGGKVESGYPLELPADERGMPPALRHIVKRSRRQILTQSQSQVLTELAGLLV